jgi:hypothetical protein
VGFEIILAANSEEKYHCGYLGLDGRMVLQLVPKSAI